MLECTVLFLGSVIMSLVLTTFRDRSSSWTQSTTAVPSAACWGRSDRVSYSSCSKASTLHSCDCSTCLNIGISDSYNKGLQIAHTYVEGVIIRSCWVRGISERLPNRRCWKRKPEFGFWMFSFFLLHISVELKMQSQYSSSPVVLRTEASAGLPKCRHKEVWLKLECVIYPEFRPRLEEQVWTQ